MTIPGQSELPLPDGRRLVSAVRVLENGARGVLLLEPDRFRVDATPAEDMFRISVRALGGSRPVSSRGGGRPLAHLESHGVDALDLPLLGAAALRVEVDGLRYDLQVGTLPDASRGVTTFTVQAVVGPQPSAS